MCVCVVGGPREGGKRVLGRSKRGKVGLIILCIIQNVDLQPNFLAHCNSPLLGAQWTGIVTTIAIEMLKAGMVEAVICVQR